MHGRVGADRGVRNGMMRGIQGPEGEVHQDFCLGGVWREESWFIAFRVLHRWNKFVILTLKQVFFKRLR